MFIHIIIFIYYILIHLYRPEDKTARGFTFTQPFCNIYIKVDSSVVHLSTFHDNFKGENKKLSAKPKVVPNPTNPIHSSPSLNCLRYFSFPGLHMVKI